MCGIITILSLDNNIKHIINGLKQLQNRGYDSAGISFFDNNKLEVIKYASGYDIDSIELLKESIKDIESSLSIAHTRWATHGAKTDENAHPHISYDGKISVVHNGIIENYKSIKNKLEQNNIFSISQTDSEIIANLLAVKYCKSSQIEQAIMETINELEGTWGLAILCQDSPNKIFCIRKGSPLIFGYNNELMIVTSEISGFNGQINNYMILDNHDILVLERNNNELSFHTEKEYKFKKVIINHNDLSPAPYKYWMEKEIMEQIDSSLRTISMGGRIHYNDRIMLGGISNYTHVFKNIDNFILLGCGTSFNSGQIGVKYLKGLNYFNTVSCYDGAEFNKLDIPINGKTGLILLSQSGETSDLYRCIRIAKEENLFMMGIINVVDSQISREVKCGIYLNAGREASVASTKSFTSQVIVLALFTMWIAQILELDFNSGLRASNLRKLYLDIGLVLKKCQQEIKSFITMLNKPSMFVLGKGLHKYIANEGALKIKEVSCIHAEGYSGSSLKHGPFALLGKGFPVILLIMNDQYKNKMMNTYEEIKSRGADLLIITDINNLDVENKIVIPTNYYTEILSVIVLQYIAFYLAIERNLNPDKPANLSKVVTVE